MFDSFSIAANGMSAQQTTLDVIANNLANANTMGFKRSRVTFADMMYRMAAESTPTSTPVSGSSDSQVGLGATVGQVSRIFDGGPLKKTGEPLDIGIEGGGFLEVVMPDGSHAYTRNGKLRVNADGMLANTDGHALSSMVRVPDDAEEIAIRPDGQVVAQFGEGEEPVDLGRIDLATFVSPSGLDSVGNNLYVATADSGDAMYATPGEYGSGTLSQGFLEASNVDMIEELTGLMMAQRAYEMNSKVVQASDRVMSIVNGLWQ